MNDLDFVLLCFKHALRLSRIFICVSRSLVCSATNRKNNAAFTEHLEMSDDGIFSGLTEHMTSVLSLVLFDQRSEVDHSEVTVHLDAVLKFMVSRTEHRSVISILKQTLKTITKCSSWKSTSHLRSITCHMGLHSVTCHPTPMN